MRISTIKEVVAAHFGITTEQLMEKRRNVEVLRPRQVAIYFSRKYTKHSLTGIGRAFDILDNKTIILGIKRVESLALESPELYDIMGNIANELNVGNLHIIPITEMISCKEKIPCRSCTKPFYRENKKNHFCSMECRKKGAADRQRVYKKLIKEGKYVFRKDLMEEETVKKVKKRMKRYHQSDSACDSGYF